MVSDVILARGELPARELGLDKMSLDARIRVFLFGPRDGPGVFLNSRSSSSSSMFIIRGMTLLISVPELP